MEKKLFVPILLAMAATMYAQTGRVGINTANPQSTLDVTGKLGSTDADGLQAPRLTLAELTMKGDTLYGVGQKGAFIFITDVSGGNTSGPRTNITTTGYYYFDGSVWMKVIAGAYVDPWAVFNGTTPASNITQNIYRMGNIAIGTSTPDPLSKFFVDFTFTNPRSLQFYANPNDVPSSISLALRYTYNGDIMDLAAIRGTGTTIDRFSVILNNTEHFSVLRSGFVGIGTTAPTTRLEINNGTTNGAIRIVDGTQGAGKVLTSDVAGVGTWQTISAAGIGIYKGRVACTATPTQVIANANVTATSTILLTYERPDNTLAISVAVGSRAVGTGFTAIYSAVPPTTAFINYTIIP